MDIPRVVTAEEKFPIQPEHICIDHPFSGAFDHHKETETAAWHLARFCQERSEGWKPFRLDRFLASYRQHCGEPFCFHNLLDGEIIVFSHGEYHFTNIFIERCYSASPATRPAVSLSKQAT